MVTNLQGSSHLPREVGFRHDKRKDFNYESGYPVVDSNGIRYAEGQKVTALTTDENGACQTKKDGLPYGKYRAKVSSVSKGYKVDKDWEIIFQIREDGTNYTMATFVDLTVNIESTFFDGKTGSKTLTIGDNVDVVDTVKYTNLNSASKYRLITDVYYVSTDGAEVTKLGSASIDFSPEQNKETDTVDGEIANTITLNTSSLQEGTLHAVDTLYRLYNDRVIQIASHNKDLQEAIQALNIPAKSVPAKESESKDKSGTTSSSSTKAKKDQSQTTSSSSTKTKKEKKSTAAAKTDDTTNTNIFFFMLVTSATVLCTICVRRRKSNHTVS